MRRWVRAFTKGWALPALFLCSPALAQPTITAISPTSANVGASVTVTGTNFSTTAGDNTVFFGATKATVTAASTTSLTATVPTGATFGPISVQVANLTAISSQFFLPTFTATVPGVDPTSLAAKVDFTTETGPIEVEVGDVDGDGKPDLIVPNWGAGTGTTVSVFRNTSTSGTVDVSSFAAKVDFTTGTSPHEVVIGDLDGDGKPDLAVVNSVSNTVSVLRNTSSSGTVSFAAKVDFTTGTDPRDLAVGDVDGDGKPDLAVPNHDGGSGTTVSVLRNTSSSGTISFAAKVDFTTGTGPTGVAIGDADGDGKPDLSVANYGANTVSVLRNTSTSGVIDASSFAAKVDFTTGTNPYAVAVGDLDGDGKADLAATNYTSGTVSVFRNTSTAGVIDASSFAAKVDFTTGANPHNSLAMGDVDGDGKLDLVVPNYGGGSGTTMSVFRNTATSGSIAATSFAAKVDFTTGTGPAGVAMGDVDGDGKPDLAVANYVANTVSVFRNQTLTTPLPTITSFTPTSAAPGASVTITGTNFSTTPANNTVFFDPIKATVTAASTTSLTVTVPNGAGYGPISVTVANRTAISKQFFMPTFSAAGQGIGSNSLAAKVDFGAGTNPAQVAVGDLDGDGKADLAAANSGTTTVSVFRNTSTSGTISGSSFATAVDFTAGTTARSLVIGDVDGDGKLDLVAANQGSNTVSVFRNTSTSGVLNSGSFAAKVDFATGTGPVNLAVGDMDGDGRLDLVVPNYSSNTVSVFRNTSSAGTIDASSFATKVDFATGTAPHTVAVGDLDGDGKAEIAVTNESANTVSVFRNTSSAGAIDASSFAAKVDFTTGTNPRGVVFGDVDGDGKLELVVANVVSNTVSVFRNTSSSGTINSGSLAAKVDLTTGSAPGGVAMGDLDGDSKAELVVANETSTTVSLFRNTSTSGAISSTSFAAKADFATSTSPQGVAVGDLDGDGKPDLVTSNAGANTLSVLRNQDPKFLEVGVAAGLNDGGTTRGVSWVDFDADGDLDLYFSNLGGTSRLWRNNTNGASFTEIGASAGVQNSGLAAHGAYWADFDNDGDFDLYQVISGVANRLYRNNGDNTFTDVAATAGVQGVAGATDYTAAWADYDQDGQVDLYLGGDSSALFRNNGNNTFTDQTTSAGVSNGSVFVSGLAWADFDSDGDQDLYLGRNTGNADRLFRNNGNGTFTDVATAAGMGEVGNRAGAAWADYDNDGDLDLYQVFASGGANKLYRNNGNSTFTDVAGTAGVNYSGTGQSAAWADWDNDGDLDLYVTDHNNEPDQKYQNNGNGTFTEVGGPTGLIDSDSGTGLSWGDYNQDGFPDLYLAIDGANRLYRNQGNQNHWLVLKLIAQEVSRDAIGAQVTAVTGATSRRRDVDGGSGYFSQPSLPVEFGLGSATTVNSLTIKWARGNENEYTNLSVDQVLTLSELARPQLVSPANASTAQSVNPTLSWNTVSGATNYRLQVATDAGFTNVVYDNNNIAGNSATLTLSSLTTYHWRVQALSATTKSSYTQAYTFGTSHFSEVAANAGVADAGTGEGGPGGITTTTGTRISTW